MSWLQVIVIGGIALAIMIGMAELMGAAHADQRKACLEAGHEWSATKYVCVAKLKK
jgi:hypothetical protein